MDKKTNSSNISPAGDRGESTLWRALVGIPMLMLVGVVLVIAIMAVVFVADLRPSSFAPDGGAYMLTDEELEALSHLPFVPDSLSTEAKIYSVSGAGEGPRFAEVIIDPLKVVPGQRQTLYATVLDEAGIESVRTHTELDEVSRELELELIDGDKFNGTWSSSWIVRDTSEKYYYTTFIARNAQGAENDIVYKWFDPTGKCVTLPFVMDSSGSYNFDGHSRCNQDQYIGIEKNPGVSACRININENINLSIDGDTQFVFNPGCEIELDLNASISIDQSWGASAAIKKGYLYVLDNDGDTFSPAGGGIPEDNGDSVYFGEELTSANLLFVPHNLVNASGVETEINRRNESLGYFSLIYPRRYLSGGDYYTRLADMKQPIAGYGKITGDINDIDSTRWQLAENIYEDKDSDGVGGPDMIEDIGYGMGKIDYGVAVNDACQVSHRVDCLGAPQIGDCHDNNPSVKPGQSNYFTSPVVSPPPGMSDPWDYDCSGTVEKQDTTVAGSFGQACDYDDINESSNRIYLLLSDPALPLPDAFKPPPFIRPQHELTEWSNSMNYAPRHTGCSSFNGCHKFSHKPLFNNLGNLSIINHLLRKTVPVNYRLWHP